VLAGQFLQAAAVMALLLLQLQQWHAAASVHIACQQSAAAAEQLGLAAGASLLGAAAAGKLQILGSF
jgi:hypothetical protein